VYTDDVPKPEELRNEARELLDVADRFGCKGLKLAAEAELAESGITVDTAAEIIMKRAARSSRRQRSTSLLQKPVILTKRGTISVCASLSSSKARR
jgi:hypothetical protein